MIFYMIFKHHAGLAIIIQTI